MEKLNLLVEQVPEVEESKRIGFGNDKESPAEVLTTMVKRHEISKLCDTKSLIDEYENATKKTPKPI